MRPCTHLGSIRLTSDASGIQLGRHDYWPFGETAPGSSDDGERMRFTGHEYDLPGGSDEGLNYMHARYESGRWGRFLSVDPIIPMGDAKPQMWNRYSYVANNPMNRTDP